MSAARHVPAELGSFYRDHLERTILPFWLERAVDEERGGVFTCIENATGRRVSTDKFVWSQARWAWLMGHAARMARRGSLGGDPDVYAAHGRRTADFLIDHAFLANGSVAYLLEADGAKKEFLPGKGHDISFFADGFVILALSETARSTRDASYVERALRSYDHVRRRLEAGTIRSEPYPLPEGCRAHAWPMIMLNVAQELHRALADLGHGRADEVFGHAERYMDDVLRTFVTPDRLVREVVCGEENGSILTGHVTPGHAIESMWFVLEEAERQGRNEVLDIAADVIERSFDVGWDSEHGGIFRYVMRDGRPPEGEARGPFERLILDTWDTKIWWPHSETLYAAALAEVLTGRDSLRAIRDRVHAYTFDTFPHPDPDVGEWIQIRDRSGRPLDKVVGLPVKDPYHITRNLMLLVELLEEGVATRTTHS